MARSSSTMRRGASHQRRLVSSMRRRSCRTARLLTRLQACIDSRGHAQPCTNAARSAWRDSSSASSRTYRPNVGILGIHGLVPRPCCGRGLVYAAPHRVLQRDGGQVTGRVRGGAHGAGYSASGANKVSHHASVTDLVEHGGLGCCDQGCRRPVHLKLSRELPECMHAAGLSAGLSGQPGGGGVDALAACAVCKGVGVPPADTEFLSGRDTRASEMKLKPSAPHRSSQPSSVEGSMGSL